MGARPRVRVRVRVRGGGGGREEEGEVSCITRCRRGSKPYHSPPSFLLPPPPPFLHLHLHLLLLLLPLLLLLLLLLLTPHYFISVGNIIKGVGLVVSSVTLWIKFDPLVITAITTPFYY